MGAGKELVNRSGLPPHPGSPPLRWGLGGQALAAWEQCRRTGRSPHPGQGLRGREEAWPESRLLQGPVICPDFLSSLAVLAATCGHKLHLILFSFLTDSDTEFKRREGKDIIFIWSEGADIK